MSNAVVEPAKVTPSGPTSVTTPRLGLGLPLMPPMVASPLVAWFSA